MGASFSLATRAQILRRIKQEELYKAISPSWEAFCDEHLPFGRRTADNLVREIDQLGGEFMLAAEQLGLGQRQLRALASAPDHLLPRAEGDEIVVGEERVPLSEKGRVLELLEQLLTEQDALKLRIEHGEEQLAKKQSENRELKETLKSIEDEIAGRTMTECDHDFVRAIKAVRKAADWLSEDTDERPHPETVLAYFRAMGESLSEIAHYGAQYVTPLWATDPDAMHAHMKDVLERGVDAVAADDVPADEWGDEDELIP